LKLTHCIRGGSLDQRPGFLLAFHYDPECVEDLKRNVPHTHREWREESKTWWVSKSYEDVLVKLFPNFDALIHLQGSLF